MRSEPGRLTGGSEATSSDQQVNAGWQGPRMCKNYAQVWQESFPASSSHVHFSDLALQARDHVSRSVASEIETALDLLPSKDHELLRLPAVPSYGRRQGRSRLAVVLKAFACWKPCIGYNKVLAALAAQILAVLGSEKFTFQILVSIYERYQLDDYFEQSEERRARMKAQDTERIWQEARFQWPDLVYAFERFNRGEELFKAAAEGLLSTLLTDAYCPEVQAFEWHVRLLHHLLLPAGVYESLDPRKQLRNTVMQIMARYQPDFQACEHEDELEQGSMRLVSQVHVDLELLSMLARGSTSQAVPIAPSLMAGSLTALFCYHALPLADPAQAMLSISAGLAGAVACFRSSYRELVEQRAEENRLFLRPKDEAGPQIVAF